MKILIVGAGAVGGYFGARLAQAGADVDFLVRGRRAHDLNQHGLTLIEPDGTCTTTPVRAVTADQLHGDHGLVLLAVKGTALGRAIDDFQPALKPGGAVLPMLNGVDHLDVLTSRLGQERVLGGVCIVGSELDSDGCIHQLVPGGSITFGELHGEPSARVDDIAAALAPADFTTDVSTTIVQDMWEKWFFMAAGGAAGVLLDGAAGLITSVDDGLEAVTAIIKEAAAVLRAAQHPVRPAGYNRVSGALTTAGSPFTTSLYRDFRAGRPTEVDVILGDMTKLGRQLGVATPLLQAATARIRVRDAAGASA